MPISPSLPNVGGDGNTWGVELNADLTTIINRVNAHADQHLPTGPDALSGYVARAQGLVADSGITDNLAALQALHDNAASGTVLLIPPAPSGSYYGLSGTFMWSKPNVHIQADAPHRLATDGSVTFKPIGTIAGPMVHRTSAAVGSHMRGVAFVADNHATNAMQDDSQDSQIEDCLFSGGTTLAYDGSTNQRVDLIDCTVLLGSGVGGATFGVDNKIIGGRYYGNKLFAGSGAHADGAHFDEGSPNVDIASAAFRVTFDGCEFDGAEGVAIIRSVNAPIKINGGRIYQYEAHALPAILQTGQWGVQIADVYLDLSAGPASFVISYGVSGAPTTTQQNSAKRSIVTGCDLTAGATTPWDLQPGFTAGNIGGGTPTLTPNANAGTGASASVVGNDKSGLITLTSGTGTPAAGSELFVQWATQRGQLPSAIILLPANVAASGRGVYASSAGYGLTGFTVSFINAPATSTAYTLWYQVVD